MCVGVGYACACMCVYVCVLVCVCVCECVCVCVCLFYCLYSTACVVLQPARFELALRFVKQDTPELINSDENWCDPDRRTIS